MTTMMVFDVNLVLLLFVAIVMAMAYGLLGWAAAYISGGSKFDLPTFLATVVYSIVVGVIAVLTGLVSLETLANWQTIFSPVWLQYAFIYTGLLYVFGKIFGVAVDKVANKVFIYPRTQGINPNHKIDEETRRTFFNDQSETIRMGILAAIDGAECNKQPSPCPADQEPCKQLWRYAIAAGAWIYLVEFGEITGAKHYFFKGWFGGASVIYKPITMQCLEAIRATGKFPNYEDLY